MALANSNLSIITLDVNGLNSAIINVEQLDG